MRKIVILPPLLIFLCSPLVGLQNQPVSNPDALKRIENVIGQVTSSPTFAQAITALLNEQKNNLIQKTDFNTFLDKLFIPKNEKFAREWLTSTTLLTEKQYSELMRILLKNGLWKCAQELLKISKQNIPLRTFEEALTQLIFTPLIDQNPAESIRQIIGLIAPYEKLVFTTWEQGLEPNKKTGKISVFRLFIDNLIEGLSVNVYLNNAASPQAANPIFDRAAFAVTEIQLQIAKKYKTFATDKNAAGQTYLESLDARLASNEIRNPQQPVEARKNADLMIKKFIETIKKLPWN